MEAVGHGFGPLHGNIGRQVAVGAPHPGAFGAVDRRIEMGHLHQTMHTRIGAASAHHIGRRGGHEFTERTLQVILDGASAGLALPAVVGCAAVGDAERNPQGADRRVFSSDWTGKIWLCFGAHQWPAPAPLLPASGHRLRRQ